MSVNVRLIKSRSNARAVDAVTRRYLYDACLDTGLAIENDVKKGPNAAPYLTGNLRSAYHVWGDRSKIEVFVGADPEIADYAPPVEYGTSRSRAQPHLRPAARAQKDPHRKRIKAAMKRAARAA